MNVTWSVPLNLCESAQLWLRVEESATETAAYETVIPAGDTFHHFFIGSFTPCLLYSVELILKSVFNDKLVPVVKGSKPLMLPGKYMYDDECRCSGCGIFNVRQCGFYISIYADEAADK